MNKKIILTSTGLSTEKAKDAVREFLIFQANKNAVLITTASKDKENNKWNIITRDQFLELGYEKVDLSIYSTVLVCGGNTFKLLKYAQTSNFKEEVIKLLNNHGLYIGTSAGSIIVTPTIAIAGEVEPDENLVNLTNLEGMNLVDFEVLPHYDPEQDSQIQAYKTKTSNEIKLISNDDILIEEYEK